MLLTFKTSLGLYWEDRKRPVLEGFTNLIVSIILGYFWGFNGIIIGTIVSNVFVNLLIEPRTIMHDGFNTSSKYYYTTACGRLIMSVIICSLCYFINSFFDVGGILEILGKSAITLVVTAFVFFIVYRKNEYAILIIRTLKIAFTKKKI